MHSPARAAGNARHTSLQYFKHGLAQENALGCSAHNGPGDRYREALQLRFLFFPFFIAVIAVSRGWPSRPRTFRRVSPAILTCERSYRTLLARPTSVYVVISELRRRDGYGVWLPYQAGVRSPMRAALLIICSLVLSRLKG